MKYLSHLPSSLHLKWVLMLAYCGLAFPMAAQETTDPPLRNELGIRTNELSISDRQIKDRNRDTHYHGQAWGLELFGVRLGEHHNFIRFSVGFSRTRDFSTEVNASDTRERLDIRQFISSSLAYGYLFTPFRGSVASRFQLRGGVSLSHRFLSLGISDYDIVTMDSQAATTTVDEATHTYQGEQELRLCAFGQMTFRIWKNLNVGLEWQVGPQVQFGGVLHHSKHRVTENDVLILETERVDKNPSPIRISFRDMFGQPFVSFGWRF